MTHATELATRLDRRHARIAVLGLGYVGLPLAAACHTAGFPVIGFDVNPDAAAILGAGRSHLSTVSDETVEAMAASGRFTAASDPAVLADADVLLLCVPTPLDRYRQPDLSAVRATARSVLPYLRPGQLVVLESTSYPGTTREVLTPILAESGLTSGEEVFVAYSPEREDPGNTAFTTSSTPKVVGADDASARDLATRFYEAVVARVVTVRDSPTAEAVKITENVFRGVNIALVNELKQIYEAMNIDIWEVQAAAATKPFGFMRFDPGPGLGGHCIPIDPFYLSWRARREGQATRFIELAGEINTAMPPRVAERCMTALNDRAARAVNGARIMVLGVAYKKNVNDTRESPAFPIMDRLRERGAEVAYHDPHVPRLPDLRHHPHLTGQAGRPLTAAELAATDMVVICTDHAGVDYHLIGEHAPIVVDTRDAMRRAGARLDRTVAA